MDVEWPSVKRNGWLDRRERTQQVIDALAGSSPINILEIQEEELREYCKKNNHTYSHATVVNGKLQGIDRGQTFDVIYVGFVLHTQADNTLNLLHQLRRMTSGFIMIGEDLAAPDYDHAWHKRNYEKCPHGVFRGDREWKCIFELFRMRLQTRYIIRRDSDPDSINVYRCVYLVRCS